MPNRINFLFSRFKNKKNGNGENNNNLWRVLIYLVQFLTFGLLIHLFFFQVLVYDKKHKCKKI